MNHEVSKYSIVRQFINYQIVKILVVLALFR